MDSYGFTIKITKSPNGSTEKHYEPFFKNLYALVDVVCICAEIDSKGLLHYHGVFRCSSTFYRKRLFMKGFHFYISYIWNMENWMKYVYKNFRLGAFVDTISDKICLECKEDLDFITKMLHTK